MAVGAYWPGPGGSGALPVCRMPGSSAVAALERCAWICFSGAGAWRPASRNWISRIGGSPILASGLRRMRPGRLAQGIRRAFRPRGGMAFRRLKKGRAEPSARLFPSIGDAPAAAQHGAEVAGCYFLSMSFSLSSSSCRSMFERVTSEVTSDSKSLAEYPASLAFWIRCSHSSLLPQVGQGMG